MPNQTRVVLDEAERPYAEHILEQTGIKSFSQLFSIFIVNYGEHLMKALKSSPAAPPPPVVMPAPEPVQARQLPTIQPGQSAQHKRFTPMAGL